MFFLGWDGESRGSGPKTMTAQEPLPVRRLVLLVLSTWWLRRFPAGPLESVQKRALGR
ncbi:DUF418 domain-containing protein [Streptomyces gobitricini]|uniref:DUF418 domain-containing protein n=1 Tax=Streptomyces gobitricini TaxID=68211 RepID=A0ABN3L4F5_9ACTN